MIVKAKQVNFWCFIMSINYLINYVIENWSQSLRGINKIISELVRSTAHDLQQIHPTQNECRHDFHMTCKYVCWIILILLAETKFLNFNGTREINQIKREDYHAELHRRLSYGRRAYLFVDNPAANRLLSRSNKSVQTYHNHNRLIAEKYHAFALSSTCSCPSCGYAV